MGAVAQAIRAERWDVAALCLIWGMVQALERLPPDALVGLMEVLEGDDGRGV